MHTKLSLEGDYLRAEMVGRQTAQETAQFLREVASASLKHDCARALILVRESRAIFKVEDFGISEFFKGMAGSPGHRVALVSDSSESYAAHGYIEVLARQRGLTVRAFREENAALEWLRGK